MQDDLIVKVYKSLSVERFQPYRVDSDTTLKPALARYLWNVALCEALYPSLNTVEVLLRNSLNDFFTRMYGTPLWFTHLNIRPHQEKTVRETVKYLIERKKITIPSLPLNSPAEQRAFKSLTFEKLLSTLNTETMPGMIVAAMPFGFWTAFFHSDFEGFWRKHPKLFQVFPYFRDRPYGDLLRKPLDKRFLAIREQLRNRVFHHEPIWNQRILYRNYEKVNDVIYWINPEKYAILKLVDRFPQVYEQGWQYYEGLLERVQFTE